MRPETARRKIKYIFNQFYRHTKKPIELIPDFQKNRAALIKLRDIFSLTENDPRPGSETYGFETIASDIEYISDRWRCQFRIQWIIDVVDLQKDKNEEKYQ